MNAAAIWTGPLAVTEQLGVVQLPRDQLANVDDESAVAVSSTVLFASKGAEQTVPQSIPLGVETMLPIPVPVFDTVTATAMLKVAETVVAESTVTSQAEPLPMQLLLHPRKAEPLWAAATSETVVPGVTAIVPLEQVSAHTGVPLASETLPAPLPCLTTVSARPPEPDSVNAGERKGSAIAVSVPGAGPVALGE